MNAYISAAEISQLKMKCGETIKMESLKKAVAPPFLMIIPFIELPDFVELARQDNLEEEGVHGCIFTLKALKPGKGKIITGFNDLKTGTPVLKKRISVKVLL